MAIPAVVASQRGRQHRATYVEKVNTDLRQLLARELHDRVAQTLTSMLVDLEQFKVDQKGRRGAVENLQSLQDSTREVLNSLRELLYDLRGTSGVEEGFEEALEGLVSRFREKTGVDVHLAILPGWPARLRAQASVNLYRIIEEALVNVRHHSGARMVHVVLEQQSDRDLAVRIADDGRGVDLLERTAPMGMGMLGMRERALFLGGQLRIDSVPGSGTTVTVVVPRERV